MMINDKYLLSWWEANQKRINKGNRYGAYITLITYSIIANIFVYIFNPELPAKFGIAIILPGILAFFTLYFQKKLKLRGEIVTYVYALAMYTSIALTTAWCKEEHLVKIFALNNLFASIFIALLSFWHPMNTVIISLYGIITNIVLFLLISPFQPEIVLNIWLVSVPVFGGSWVFTMSQYFPFKKIYILNKKLQDNILELSTKNQEIEKINRTMVKQQKSLEENNEELLKLSHFKNQTIRALAHDMKNPLNIILNADIFSEDKKDKVIKYSAKQMLQMVLNLLDLHKSQTQQLTLNFQPIRITDHIKKSVEEYELMWKEKKINVVIEVSNEMLIKSDPTIFERICSNLLNNALRYSDMEKNIFIRAEYKNKGMIKISFIDEGYGISDEDQKFILKDFIDLDINESSKLSISGFGLAFAKIAVEEHGGNIGFESKKGKGSTFWITIPAWTKPI